MPATAPGFKLKHTFAALPRTQRGKRLCIKGDPKGTKMLYPHGKGVVIRSVENPMEADVYTEHAQDVISACYSTNGNYICSGDKTGKVRIWDTLSEAHVLKAEYRPIGGDINDICWGPESKRIGVCGNGRGLFAHAFLADTGSGVGTLNCHSKTCNTIDFKQARPYRLVTSSEDYSVGFYKGPPFKFITSNKDHSNFVNVARFSPNGQMYISGSSDGRLLLYNAETSEKIKEVFHSEPEKAHKGSVYDLAWGPDSKHVLTASGDKTAKIFDVDEGKCITEFTFGDHLNHQQLACAWIGEQLITVELSGYINYLDRDNPSKPKRVLKGHNKNITSLVISEGKKKIYTGSYDGQIYIWDPTTGMCEPMGGQTHSNQVSRMCTSGPHMYSISKDDTLMVFSTENDQYTGEGVSFDTEPIYVSSAKDGLVVVCCMDQSVVVIRNSRKICSKKFEHEVSCVAVHPNQTEIAIGHGTEPLVHLYSLDNDTISELKETVTVNRESSVLEYSHDGAYLAIGQADRSIMVYDTSNYGTRLKSFTSHSSRITCLAWSPDSVHLASGSLDTNLFVWSMDSSKKNEQKAAHKLNVVVGVGWLSDNVLVSSSHDCSVKIWDITHP